MAERGVASVVASDYFWPAMLEAAFIMAGRGAMDLPRAWALVSSNPAEACGLRDRGRLEVGLRGDVLVLDEARRAPVAVFAQGRRAWLAPAPYTLLPLPTTCRGLVSVDIVYSHTQTLINF